MEHNLKATSQSKTQIFEIDSLVQKHTKGLLRCALGCGLSAQDAEEVVQSTWVTFVEVLPKFEGKSKISTFLFGILYNKISEQRRQSRKLSPDENIEEKLDSHFDSTGHWKRDLLSPDQFVAALQIQSHLEDCLSRLPESHKMAFVLREITEEDTEDICRILETNANGLGVMIFRARAKLRECIETKGWSQKT
jgi:RNA polymerase sigma-70 factor (ECF subfamily)